MCSGSVHRHKVVTDVAGCRTAALLQVGVTFSVGMVSLRVGLLQAAIVWRGEQASGCRAVKERGLSSTELGMARHTPPLLHATLA